MPKLRNYIPFPNFRYYSGDNQGKDFGVLIVKGTYELAPSGRLLIAREQAPMVFTDECHGAVNVTSLRHPSDLVPNKPATDIILNAVARAPNGRPAPHWPCGISVSNMGGEQVLSKRLRVCGPRWWQPEWRRPLSEREQEDWKRHEKLFAGWRLTESEPIAELPLHYEYAYGGVITRGLDEDGKPNLDCDRRNPLGRGMLDAQESDKTVRHPAPQIEAEGDPVRDAYHAYTPESLGPIPPAWQPRLPLGGTYDQNWIDTIWPNWAPDYQFAFHNSAHPDLIVKDYLTGEETITLLNLAYGYGELRLALPGHGIEVGMVKPDGSEDRQRMNLDTVMIDISARKRRAWRIFLSWRLNFEPDVYSELHIHGQAPNLAADDVRTTLANRGGRIAA